MLNKWMKIMKWVDTHSLSGYSDIHSQRSAIMKVATLIEYSQKELTCLSANMVGMTSVAVHAHN